MQCGQKGPDFICGQTWPDLSKVALPKDPLQILQLLRCEVLQVC